MRRTLAATLVALSLAASTGAASPSFAADGDDLDLVSPQVAPAAPVELPTPAQALDNAQTALAGGVEGLDRPEASLALRDLFEALPRLTGDDREQAEAILARPTDGAQDPNGDGYTVRAKKKCAKTVCVHWVPSTADQAGKKWVNKSLRTMKSVWRKEVGTMGYRRPVKDGRVGGKGGKFDVYLKDLGSQGLYGYCAPEYRIRGKQRDASGYCVLDNDFARDQYGAKPINSLRVTAAHEFFHAIQFGYDFREDLWLMEATATWMEERVYDGVDDNRQYLRDSQVVAPFRALDTFDRNSSIQYGNWIFFEYLTKRFGAGIVKRTWNNLDGAKGKTYSINGVKKALPRKTSLKQVYSQFAAANVTPAKSYAEGKHWPAPTMAGTGRLGKGQGAAGTVEISHLSNNPFRLTPKKELRKRSFKLRVKVDGPKRRTSPAAMVVVQRKSGKIQRTPVKLSKAGKGSKVVPFNRRQVKRVYVVAINASTRYECGAGNLTYACNGRPKDQSKAFALNFRVVNKRR